MPRPRREPSGRGRRTRSFSSFVNSPVRRLSQSHNAPQTTNGACAVARNCPTPPPFISSPTRQTQSGESSQPTPQPVTGARTLGDVFSLAAVKWRARPRSRPFNLPTARTERAGGQASACARALAFPKSSPSPPTPPSLARSSQRPPPPSPRRHKKTVSRLVPRSQS